MKDWIILLIVGLVIYIAGILSFINITDSQQTIITKTDTICVYVPDSSLVNQIDSLCYKIDSLEQINSEYFTELTIATIKLERIRDYNRIAANGNNIKYLRGWINRTLED